jgi:hypothetical protein
MSNHLKNEKPNRTEKRFVLSDEKYQEFLSMLAEDPIYQLPQKKFVEPKSNCELGLYLKGKLFKTHGVLYSHRLYNYLFKDLISYQGAPK